MTWDISSSCNKPREKLCSLFQASPEKASQGWGKPPVPAKSPPCRYKAVAAVRSQNLSLSLPWNESGAVVHPPDAACCKLQRQAAGICLQSEGRAGSWCKNAACTCPASQCLRLFFPSDTRGQTPPCYPTQQLPELLAVRLYPLPHSTPGSALKD